MHEPTYTATLPSNKFMCADCVKNTATVPESASYGRTASGCFVIKNHVEMCDLDYRAVVAGQLNPGDTDTYTCEILDDAGKVLATTEGVSWKTHNRPSDGHLMSYYRERITFADGAIETSGWLDINAIEEGGWIGLNAVGITGAYHGKVGVRELWQEEKRRKFRANIVLCGQPEL